MKIKFLIYNHLFFSALYIVFFSQVAFSQNLLENPELDKKVKAFLSDNRYSWRDMNVPASDGQLLFDIIVENGYKMLLK